MLILRYKTKKELKQCIGQPLRFDETSIFGPEFRRNGDVFGTNHPKRSWYAKVTMKDGVISKVS